ncbi:hypothetical protein [Paenibacillus abyssi]|uniref:Uncharacterized protein n=1 Tax=Paenibacillus abyssi TaxID=1340531 RepID=A0A917FSV6_9BACL|nr:hypothetical protein [Paenibacillus abyssi]GGG05438.1 hypothetical protein GCM10010916_23130 [Paenibacillus abyssi]
MYELDKSINWKLENREVTLKEIYPKILECLVISHNLNAGETCPECKEQELVEIDIYTLHDMVQRRCKLRTVSKTIIEEPNPQWFAICPCCDQYALGIDDNLEILMRNAHGMTFSRLAIYLNS